MTLRVLFLSALIALSACRPHVELEIHCDRGLSDLGCPTGYHCGEEGYCVEGERPPRVTFYNFPDFAMNITGFSFELLSPLGIDTVEAWVEPEDGSFILEPRHVNVDYWRSGRVEGAGFASFDTGLVPNGNYIVFVRATTAQEPILEIVASQPVVFDNREIDASITATDTLHGETQVGANFYADQPIHYDFWMERNGDRHELPGLTDNSFSDHTRSVSATLKSWEFPDGEIDLVAEVWVDVGDLQIPPRRRQLRKTVRIDNGVPRLQLTEVLDQFTARASGTVTVRTSGEALAGVQEFAATIEGTAPDGGTLIVPASSIDVQPLWTQNESVFAAKYEASFDSTLLADGPATVRLELLGMNGKMGVDTVEVYVDNTPPSLVGEVEAKSLINGPQTVTFACSEPANFVVRNSYPDYQGTCDETRQTYTVQNADSITRIDLVDLAGHEGSGAPTRIVRGRVTSLEQVSAATDGRALAVGEASFLDIPYSDLYERNGEGVTLSRTPAQMNDASPKILRVAPPLLAGSGSVHLMSVEEDVVRFLYEQRGHRDDVRLLSLWEMDRERRLHGPSGQWETSSTSFYFPPVFHADQKRWFVADGNRITVTSFERQQSSRNPPNISLKYSSSVFCEGQVFAAGTGTMLFGLRTGLDADGNLEDARAFSTNLPMSDASVHLLCVDDQVLAVVTGFEGTRVFTVSNAQGNPSWSESPLSTSMRPRLYPMAGGRGLIGGGYSEFGAFEGDPSLPTCVRQRSPSSSV